MFSGCYSLIQKYSAPYKIKRGSWPFHSFWDPRDMEKRGKKSQTRVQIIYSIFYSVMFLKQRQNTYNYISWTLFGDNIKT